MWEEINRDEEAYRRAGFRSFRFGADPNEQASENTEPFSRSAGERPGLPVHESGPERTKEEVNRHIVNLRNSFIPTSGATTGISFGSRTPTTVSWPVTFVDRRSPHVRSAAAPEFSWVRSRQRKSAKWNQLL